MGDDFPSLLDRARNGDSDAFGEIYRRLNPSLVSYVAVMSPSDADDLASDAWLAAATHLSSFEGDESAFRGWLFTIARRKLIDLSRGAARRLTRPTDLSATDIPSRDDGPEHAVIESMTVAELAHHVVRHLTADQAEVVLLGAIGGFRAVEIAEILGKSAGSVRMLQHKAFRRLANTPVGLLSGVE